MVLKRDTGSAVATEQRRNDFVIDLADAEEVTLSEVRRAMLEAFSGYLEKPVSDVENEVGESEIVGTLCVEIRNDPDVFDVILLDLARDLSLHVELTVESRKGDSDEAWNLFESLATRNGFRLTAAKYSKDVAYDGLIPYWVLEMVAVDLDRTIGETASLKRLAVQLRTLRYAEKGRFPRFDWETSRDLLLAGLPSFLLGQEESAWLEVKSQLYPTSAAGEIELAKDVARFANGDGPGLLVLGFREKVRGGRRVIDKVTPLPTRNLAGVYHRLVDRLVFPMIRGLQIEDIDLGAGSVIVVVIPAQLEQEKPFLVTGAMVDGKCEGAFISIVRRRGEHSIPITAAEIHGLIVAGRNSISGRESLTSDIS